MPKKTKSLRLIACVATLIITALAIPSAASASTGQLSMIQEDRRLFGQTGEDPAAVMSEIRSLGVDMLRTNVIYGNVYRTPIDRTKPAGFVTSDPNSPQYNWAPTDRLVNAAQANGIQLLMTITTPGPAFSSSSPNRCPRVPCTYKPKPAEFGDFAAAVAKRYRGRVAYYSIGNEFNLNKLWLTPRIARSGGKRYDFAAATYRKMWLAGYKAIAANDPGRRNRVLFGETAAIGSPLPFLQAALCLDSKGNPLKGKIRTLQGCSGKVAKLNIAGFAHHPYNQGGNGTPRQKTPRKVALPMAHMPRLHKLLSQAARRKRIPGGRGIFITEFGFQSNPPDRVTNVSLAEQAQYINEADRLFYADRRIKAVNQFELTDPPQLFEFNMGLRRTDGTKKPAYDAYRVPLVVTRRSANSVEVYGEVRPHRVLSSGPSTQVSIQVSQGGGAFTAVKNQRTNRRGFLKLNINRRGAARARWRLVWQNGDTGEFVNSRVAKAGKKLVYYKN
jgi:hypothetical protein